MALPRVDRVFVVHCRRLRGRRALLEASLRAHGMAAEWVEDLDPGGIPPGLLARRLRTWRLSPGEVSLYLKHEAVLRRVVAEGIGVALVLEDDALLGPDFPQRFAEQAAWLPPDFDLAFLGESCRLRRTPEDNPCFARADSTRSTNGYLVTGRAARSLLGRLHRIDRPIDHKMTEVLRAEGLAAWWGEPPLVGNGSSRGVHSYSLKWRALDRVRVLLRVLGWGSGRRRDLLGRWRREHRTALDGRLHAHGGDLLRLQGAVVDPARCHPHPDGYLELEKGFLRLGEPPALGLPPPMDRCLSSMVPEAGGEALERPGLTVAVARWEVFNPYHTLADLYDVFLASRFLGRDPAATRVLFLDACPREGLRPLWDRLYPGSGYPGDLEGPTRVEDLAVVLGNHQSPLSPCLGPAPPLLREFRTFLLDRLGLLVPPPRAGPPRITLVRRETDASGQPARRRLANSSEVAEALGRAFPGAEVREVALERLDPLEQVALVRGTDVLVGVHGAGLAHLVALPEGGAVVELFPGIRHALNFHYWNLARWLGIPYSRWIDGSRGTEPASRATRVPPAAVVARVRRHLRRRPVPSEGGAPGLA